MVLASPKGTEPDIPRSAGTHLQILVLVPITQPIQKQGFALTSALTSLLLLFVTEMLYLQLALLIMLPRWLLEKVLRASCFLRKFCLILLSRKLRYLCFCGPRCLLVSLGDEVPSFSRVYLFVNPMFPSGHWAIHQIHFITTNFKIWPNPIPTNKKGFPDVCGIWFRFRLGKN